MACGSRLIIIKYQTRSMETMGNYDQISDYIFHQDGSLEVMVNASGYL